MAYGLETMGGLLGGLIEGGAGMIAGADVGGVAGAAVGGGGGLAVAGPPGAVVGAAGGALGGAVLGGGTGLVLGVQDGVPRGRRIGKALSDYVFHADQTADKHPDQPTDQCAGNCDQSGEANKAEPPPRRITNDKHHPNSESPEPKNAQELYDKSIPARDGTRWAKDEDGVIHRFSKPSNGDTHWNGSTSGPRPIRENNIPPEIKKAFK